MLQKEYILFISCLYYLSVHFYSCFLYTESWRYKRDYLHVSTDILFCIMFYIMNKTKKHQDSFIPRSYLRYKERPDLNLAPQSTICSYASGPVTHCQQKINDKNMKNVQYSFLRKFYCTMSIIQENSAIDGKSDYL